MFPHQRHSTKLSLLSVKERQSLGTQLRFLISACHMHMCSCMRTHVHTCTHTLIFLDSKDSSIMRYIELTLQLILLSYSKLSSTEMVPWNFQSLNFFYFQFTEEKIIVIHKSDSPHWKYLLHLTKKSKILLTKDLKNTWVDGPTTRVTTSIRCSACPNHLISDKLTPKACGHSSDLWGCCTWYQEEKINCCTWYLEKKITDTQNSDWREYRIKGSFLWGCSNSMTVEQSHCLIRQTHQEK